MGIAASRVVWAHVRGKQRKSIVLDLRGSNAFVASVHGRGTDPLALPVLPTDPEGKLLELEKPTWFERGYMALVPISDCRRIIGPRCDEDLFEALLLLADIRRKSNPCECRHEKGRTMNPSNNHPTGELRVVIRPAGKNGSGVELFSVCLGVVENGRMRLYSCGKPTKTALEAALDEAKRLAKTQGLAVDSNGILLEEPDPKGKERLAAVVVSKAKTTEGLAKDLVEQVPELARAKVVAKTPAGLVRVQFDAKGRPTDVRVGRKSSRSLVKALGKDLAAQWDRKKAAATPPATT